MDLPKFEYFPDPVGNGCIVEREAFCACCEKTRPFMYQGPIYCTEDVSEVCPWCIADGAAAAKWTASFHDLFGIPSGVPNEVIQTIDARTPGYETWQGNKWLFSENDALVFMGEVVGAELVKEGDPNKVQACLEALKAWSLPGDFNLKSVVAGGQPAIYLFRDRRTLDYYAYADMT
jgi:uncharacterized protein CbrC (UPF0167 family)